MLKLYGHITWEECALAKSIIRRRLGPWAFLAWTLKEQKKGYTLAHRIAYYERWIQALKKKGE